MSKNSFRANDCSIEGKSAVHDSVDLYRAVRIADSVIGEDSVICDNSDILSTVVGQRCSIGRRNFVYESSIGDGTYTGPNTVIRNCNIGKYCCVSCGDSLGGRNHNYKSVSLMQGIPIRKAFGVEPETLDHAPFCSIGNDVWIATNVSVIDGAHIGDGAVIGAGAVVINDIPPYAIAVGVPAKIVKYRFGAEIIERLLELRWWDFDLNKLQKAASLLQSNMTEAALDTLERIKRA